MLFQKKMKYAISIAIILIATLATLIFYTLSIDPVVAIKQAQISPSNTAKALLYALVSNDEYMLNAIVVAEQQGQVEKWLGTHAPFYCTKLDALITTFPNVQNANFDKPQVAIFDLQPAHADKVYINALYYCSLDQGFGGLNFEVREIIIERIDNRWYVSSWGNICKVESLAGCG